MTEPNEKFSPFDAPIKGSRKIGQDQKVPVEEINSNEFSEQKQQPPPQQPPQEDVGQDHTTATPPKDAPEFQIPKFDDVPEADMGSFGSEEATVEEGGEDAEKGGTTDVPESFSTEFSEYTAKWLVDIYFRLFIAGIKEYAKIDRTEVLKAVNEGYIDSKFIKFIDEANENVDSNVEISESEKEFIIEPLKYFLEIKKIQLKPEYMVLISLVIVSGSIFMNAQDLKSQNREVLDKIIEESRNIREKKPSSQPRPSTEPPPEPAAEDVQEFTEEKATGTDDGSAGGGAGTISDVVFTED